MKRIYDDFKKTRFDDLYSFLQVYDHNWLSYFFQDKDDFEEFLKDDDVRLLVYEDDNRRLCCVVIIDEVSILTIAFSDYRENDQAILTILNDAESLMKDLHYVNLSFGIGNNSYGVYDREHPHLTQLLISNGFVLEAAAYDISYADAPDNIITFLDQIQVQKIIVPYKILGTYHSLNKELR